MWFIALLLFGMICAFAAQTVAEAKGWSSSNWFIAGLLLGPIGVLAAAGMPDRLQRRLLRLIAVKQGVFGEEPLLSTTFETPKDCKADEGWEIMKGCFSPVVAGNLSRKDSMIYSRLMVIKDFERVEIAEAKGSPREGGGLTWQISLKN